MKSEPIFRLIRFFASVSVVLTTAGIISIGPAASGQGGQLRDPVLRSIAGVGSVQHAAWYRGLTQLRTTNGTEQVHCFAETDPGASVDFTSVGAEDVMAFGDVYVLYLPTNQIQNLAGLAGIRDIRAARKLSPLLDVSVPDPGDGSTGLGIDLVDPGEPYGYGTVVGIVDTGVEWTHQDFLDRWSLTNRIVSSWDQNAYPVSMTSPAEGEAGHPDTDGHGTHVAGVACGNGRSLVGRDYTGVAAACSIVAVSTSFYDADIARGVRHVFEVAETLDAPAVANLSLGGHDGPHDSSDPFDRAMDSLSGPGRIIVCAAGNEGEYSRHAGGPVTVTGGIARAQSIRYDNGADGYASFNLYHDSPSGLQVWVQRGDSSSVGPVLPGDSLDLPDIVVENTPGGTDPDTAKSLIHITTWTGPVDTSDWHILLSKLDEADPDAEFHAWVSYTDGDSFIRPDGDFPGNSDSTVGSPATAVRTVSVGAYVTKTDAGWGPEGELATFSSRGPTADGRPGIDICTPGTVIRSTCSDTAGGCVDGYSDYSGTSMAAPHVTGLTAILLQEHPTLSPEAVKSILATSARTADTGDPAVPPSASLPDADWGYGKLDAAPAIDLARELATLPEPTVFLIH